MITSTQCEYTGRRGDTFACGVATDKLEFFMGTVHSHSLDSEPLFEGLKSLRLVKQVL